MILRPPSARAGFTLLELFIVLLLLTVLIALFLPFAVKVRGENDVHVLCRNNMKQLDLQQGWRSAANKAPASAGVRTFLCWAVQPAAENVTSYVGVAGAGADAATLPLEDPRTGFFGYSRTLKTADIKRGAANVLV